MQGLPRTQLEAIADKLGIFGVSRPLEYFMPAVAFVIEQGMTDVFHVGSDLVGSACFKPAFQQGYIPQSFEHPIVGHSWFTTAPVRENGHLLTVSGITADVAFHRTRVMIELSPSQCFIETLRCFMEKLPTKKSLGCRVYGHHQQTRSVFINAVDQPWPWIIDRKHRVVSEMPGQAIDQGAGKIAMSRMHHHAGWFVYDQQDL